MHKENINLDIQYKKIKRTNLNLNSLTLQLNSLRHENMIKISSLEVLFLNGTVEAKLGLTQVRQGEKRVTKDFIVDILSLRILKGKS